MAQNDLCMHAEEFNSLRPDSIVCPIRGNVILNKKFCDTCDYYDYDFSNHREKICGTCKHYLGYGDWGLSCRKDYYALPTFLTKACEHYEV